MIIYILTINDYIYILVTVLSLELKNIKGNEHILSAYSLQQAKLTLMFSYIALIKLRPMLDFRALTFLTA